MIYRQDVEVKGKSLEMYIKDLQTGMIRKYGLDQHDSLRIEADGTCLTYEHLQCGDGSIPGDKAHSGFVFCDEDGHTPEENEILCRYGVDDYFNIGGWDNIIREPVVPIGMLREIKTHIEQLENLELGKEKILSMLSMYIDTKTMECLCKAYKSGV